LGWVLLCFFFPLQFSSRVWFFFSVVFVSCVVDLLHSLFYVFLTFLGYFGSLPKMLSVLPIPPFVFLYFFFRACYFRFFFCVTLFFPLGVEMGRSAFHPLQNLPLLSRDLCLALTVFCHCRPSPHHPQFAPFPQLRPPPPPAPPSSVCGSLPGVASFYRIEPVFDPFHKAPSPQTRMGPFLSAHAWSPNLLSFFVVGWSDSIFFFCVFDPMPPPPHLFLNL